MNGVRGDGFEVRPHRPIGLAETRATPAVKQAARARRQTPAAPPSVEQGAPRPSSKPGPHAPVG